MYLILKNKEIMEKEFVPYEQSSELKELGFNETCFKVYDDLGFLQKESVMNTCEIECDVVLERYLAPLYQQAFRWFREKHGKNAILFSDGFQWTFDLRWIDHEDISQYPFVQFPKKEVGREMFDTYEEAELECLKKLIEIVKNK
jgi:hypothetical protein